MGIYISHTGQEKDTSTMAYPYLVSALKRARENGTDNNVKVLEEEIALRDSQNAQ